MESIALRHFFRIKQLTGRRVLQSQTKHESGVDPWSWIIRIHDLFHGRHDKYIVGYLNLDGDAYWTMGYVLSCTVVN